MKRSREGNGNCDRIDCLTFMEFQTRARWEEIQDFMPINNTESNYPAIKTDYSQYGAIYGNDARTQSLRLEERARQNRARAKRVTAQRRKERKAVMFGAGKVKITPGYKGERA